MLTISVKSDLEKIIRGMGPLTSKQLPFSIAKTLTQMAKDVQKQVTADLPKDLQNPTAFTKRAFTIMPARKTDLTAWVFAKDRQARYLAMLIQGSERRVKGFERKADALAGESLVQLVPTRNMKLDASGNVSQATLKRIASAKNAKRYFIGTPKGGNRPFGIYMRHNADKRLTALMVEADVGKYDRRLDLEGVAKKIFETSFRNNLQRNLQQAMATAKG